MGFDNGWPCFLNGFPDKPAWVGNVVVDVHHSIEIFNERVHIHQRLWTTP